MDLSTLRTSARGKADEDATGFIGNPELNRYLNQGMRLIYGKIAQRFENYFVIPGTTGNGGKFSTVANTQEYSLPSDMIKCVRVEFRQSTSVSDNDWIALQNLNIGNDGFVTYYPPREGYNARFGFGYFIAGNKIYLRPVPSHVFTVRIWYVPRGTEMSADSDTPIVPEEYHELIAEYGAIQMLAKSGEGIWKERSDMFKLELENMLETVEVRNQQPEQIQISEWYDYQNPWGGIL